MSERTRQAVWEEIQMSELSGSGVVPLPIETAKLLLRCARFVNEVAGERAWGRGRSQFWQAQSYLLSEDEVRNKAKELEALL